MISYVTDVEGRWDKLAAFAANNPHVWLADGALRLAAGVTFVFGGDAIDRGPDARRIVRTLLDARRTYGERVVLLAGNRDINKLRLARELDGAPPSHAPAEIVGGPRGALLRWILASTMGAKDAFEHRATELEAEGRGASDGDIVSSFLDDLGPTGDLRAYLERCQLAFRADETLLVHGGVTHENFGVVPGRAGPLTEVDAWVDALNGFYAEEMHAFTTGREPSALIAYQAPLPGTRWNQTSVVYARLTDDHANPRLPSEETIARLRASGVRRVIVGHTPSGDCPAIVSDDDDFEVVLADNSYGRIESGSQLWLTSERVAIDATTELDGGERAHVRFEHERADRRSPIGRRDPESGRLVKARLASGDYLLFRGLPGYRVEQTRSSADALAGHALVSAR